MCVFIRCTYYTYTVNLGDLDTNMCIYQDVYNMKIDEKVFKMFPGELNESELAALTKIAVSMNSAKDTLKLKDKEEEKLLGFGENKKDQVLSSLVDKKLISREQKRNSKGQFELTEIRIITPLITD